MIIDDILEIEPFECIEPTFDALVDDYYTSLVLDTSAEEGRLLIDEAEYPVAIALRTDNGWKVASFVARPAGIPLIEKMEAVGGDVYQESRETWLRALREYYSRMIVEGVPPALQDTRLERVEMVKTLIRDLWGGDRFSRCLDCCCGSGVGSTALRDAGIVPIAYDNDSALLSLGFSTGRLRPEETICIDATRATAYLEPVEAGICLMMGDISSFTSGMWRQITNELLALTEVTLITAATEPEIRMIEEWCITQDRECMIFEQESDPIYDRWVCEARLV